MQAQTIVNIAVGLLLAGVAALFLAFVIRVIKRRWIEKKPMGTGAAMVVDQLMMDLSTDQGRQALVEQRESGERPLSDDDGFKRDDDD